MLENNETISFDSQVCSTSNKIPLFISLQRWEGNELEINIYTCIKDIHVFPWRVHWIRRV